MDNYSEAEKTAFEDGVQHERARVKKIFDRYHQAICDGTMDNHPDCEKTMSLRYINEYISEKKSPR